MSYIKQKPVKAITEATVLALLDMGIVIANSASPIAVTIPTAVGNIGLWYNIINVGAGTLTISDGSEVTTIVQGVSKFLVSDSVAWAVSQLDYDQDTIAFVDGKIQVKDNVFEAFGTVATHEAKSIFDVGGIHGFVSTTPTTPDDGKALVWDEAQQKHVYSPLVDKTISISDWDSTVTYSLLDGCYYSGQFYKSAIDNNLNNTPGDPDYWLPITSEGGGGGGGGGFINIEEAEYTATGDGVTTIPMVLSYDPDNDYIYLIYQNTYLIKDDEFSVTGTDINLEGWSIDTGEKINYIIAHGGETYSADNISLDTTPFTDGLDSSIDTVQKLAETIDANFATKVYVDRELEDGLFTLEASVRGEIHELVNIAIDIFEDETGIDSGSSSQQVYDGDSHIYYPGPDTSVTPVEDVTPMTLVSEYFTCATTPSYAYIIAKDTIPEGSTITYYISRDNGITWTEATKYDITDITSQPDGTLLRIKAVTSGGTITDYPILKAWAWGWK